jgi:(4S)-4-hydroxy-5-phosphonooxypentane-2,3-dione isomerase
MIALSVVYTVKPGVEEAVLEALERMKQIITEDEPGCLIYQVSRVRELPNTLLLYEVYKDEEALGAHAATRHFEAIIKGEVIPMLVSRVRTVCDVQIS